MNTLIEDGDGVFHGKPRTRICDIDMTSVFGVTATGLHRREPTLKPKQFNEPKCKTKYRFVTDLSLLVRDLSDPLTLRCSDKERINRITAEINDLVYEYFKESP